MFTCPRCQVPLVQMKGERGVFWWCSACDGRSATVSLLRRNLPREAVNALWQAARTGSHPRNSGCPACCKLMVEVPAGSENNTQFVDVCTSCQFVWFDSREYEAMPSSPQQTDSEPKLPSAAREKLAILELDSIREKARGSDWACEAPDEWWHWIPALLGMPVEHEPEGLSRWPWITWGLAAIVSVVSILAFFDLRDAVQLFGFIPTEFGRYGGLTLLTSFFLHAGIFHLLGNLYFFMVFGDNVEDFLGKGRFVLLLLCSTLLGNLLHALGAPDSTLPCVGASGGISGVITFYALTFPRARLGILVGAYFRYGWIRMPAYAMFLMWVALQAFGVWAQLAGSSNVSSLAHLGGAAVGVVFWGLTRKG